MKPIRVEDVTKIFTTSIIGRKKVKALQNITFQLDEGENLAIMGPSPSGKTTLLKMIAGIYLPDKGDIHIYNHSVKRKTEEVRRLTYYISPQIQLNKKLTVREVIRYFKKITGKEINTQVTKLLSEVEIHPKNINKRIETLSETQTIVLKLALGLIKEPKILLLDNIFSSLEPKVRESFQTAIEEITNITLLIIDRDMEALNRFCKKVLLLSKEGKMITIGPVSKLLKDYPYKYDIEVTLKKTQKREVTEIYKYPHQKMGTMIRFYLKDENEVLNLTEALLKREKEIIKLQISGIDIEDIYYWILNRQREKDISIKK